MRKLLFALLLVPLACRAELVIEDGQLTPAYPSEASAVAPTPVSAPTAEPAYVPSTASAPAAESAEPSSDTKSVWQVELTDSTFQKLFDRWAKLADWTLVWDVPQDIPVIGQYTFSGKFTDAVFAVTNSTNGTDLPIHPCFYTNNVVRIVPVSVVCNPDNS
ncbi:toxin co-regulated pilus biosynthesis Q family protein [Trinickia acidisoli]|uniref:toxin co-regulated pilus biosynthesis Q family protein n=1 Tax=Trinickia acidisoli TaxID=2767482 RepID=UPI001A8C0524|nr:toxin co-regulated pilus biosynthesis Q family protein [Trinickia acidisoli]